MIRNPRKVLLTVVSLAVIAAMMLGLVAAAGWKTTTIAKETEPNTGTKLWQVK